MDYKDLNDYELIYQVKENDDVAYNALITKYSNLVNMISRKYIRIFKGIGLEREDLFQAGMLGIFQALDDYNSDNTVFYTYAALCAKREMKKLIKMSTRQKYKALNEAISFDKPISTNVNLTISETISSGYDIESDYLLQEDFKRLYDFKYDLPFLESMIFELRFNGFRVKEIAILLDIPYATIEYHMSKIRKKAKNVLI